MKRLLTLARQTTLFCAAVLFVMNFAYCADAQDNINNQENFINKKCCLNVDDLYLTIALMPSTDNLPKKNEFETSSQYNERIKATKNAEHLKVDKHYLFKINEDAIWSKYDADNNNLRFGIKDSAHCEPSVYNKQTNANIFTIDVNKEENKREYVGENAFGVKRTVVEHGFSIKSIYLTNFSQLRKYIQRDEFEKLYLNIFSKNYSIDDAKAIKNRINMFVLVKPEIAERGDSVCDDRVLYGKKKQEYTWYYSYTSDPTIDHPIAIKRQYDQLNAKIVAIITVDSAQNEIINFTFYGKVQPDISKFISAN